MKEGEGKATRRACIPMDEPEPPPATSIPSLRNEGFRVQTLWRWMQYADLEEEAAFVAHNFVADTRTHFAIMSMQFLAIPGVLFLLEGESRMVILRTGVCTLPQLFGRFYLARNYHNQCMASTHFFWLVYFTTASHWAIVIVTDQKYDWSITADGGPFLLVLFFLFALQQGYLLCTVACLKVGWGLLSASTCLLLCALSLVVHESKERQIVSDSEFFFMLVVEVVLCNVWVCAQLHERRLQFKLTDEVWRQRDRLRYELSFANKLDNGSSAGSGSYAPSLERIQEAGLGSKSEGSSQRRGRPTVGGGSSYGTDSELFDEMVEGRATRSNASSQRGSISVGGGSSYGTDSELVDAVVKRGIDSKLVDDHRRSNAHLELASNSGSEASTSPPPAERMALGMRRRQQALWNTLDSMGIKPT